jgi:hypothetical protein
MKDLNIKKHMKQFKVAAVSSNTNSFGLYRMIVISKDGEAYKLHASMYNVKKQGDFINQVIMTKDDRVIRSDFYGCEMPIRLPQVKKDVLNELFQ